jgi:hypothetical protein
MLFTLEMIRLLIKISHRILSTILGTFRTFYLKILSTSTFFSVQVHVLVLRKMYWYLYLSTIYLSPLVLSTGTRVHLYLVPVLSTFGLSTNTNEGTAPTVESLFR